MKWVEEQETLLHPPKPSTQDRCEPSAKLRQLLT